MLNRVDLLRIFCAAAQAGSFRQAAAHLGISPQAVTRAVKSLEDELGEVLFHRNTRRVHITAYGQALAQQARLALDGLDELFRRNVRDDNGEISGRVGITAPQALGRRVLLDLLLPLLRRYPNLQVELRLADEPTDSVSAQIDIGVRVGLIRDRRYIARPLAQVPFHVVATPQLLAATGNPESLEALMQRPLSALIDRNSGRVWPWMFAEGQVLSPQRPAFVCDDAEAELTAVLGGLAYGQLPGYLAVPYIRSGALVTVLDELAPSPWELFIYRPQRGPVPARVRLIYDYLLERFADPASFAVHR